MQRTVLAILMTTLLARAGSAGDDPDDQGLFTIEIQKIADDVYVASRPEPLRFRIVANLRQACYRATTIRPPTLLVADRLSLRRGERTIEIRFLGQGDTRGDLVVYLPRERIVVTGDLVVHPVPYGFSRQPLRWRETLGRLSGLPFDILVPGHGDVQHGPDYLRQVMGLLDTTATAVREGRSRGQTAAQIRASLDAPRLGAPFAGGNPVFQYFFEEYFLNPNVERTWNELAATRE